MAGRFHRLFAWVGTGRTSGVAGGEVWMMRTMMEPGARRQGRTGRTGWPTTAGLPDGRAALLAALDAYRRGAAEAPVVCKQGSGLGCWWRRAAGDEIATLRSQ